MTGTKPAGRHGEGSAGPGLPASVLACALALCVMAVTFRAMAIVYLPVPYWDQWYYVTPAQTLSSLWKQHNEHRLVLYKLISAADMLLVSGRHYIDFGASLFIQAAHALLLSGLILAAGPWRGSVRIAFVIALVSGALFWGLQWENFFWAFQAQFFGVYAAATLAFWLLCRGRGAGGAGLAFLAALASLGFMSNGLVALVILPLLAWALGRPARQVVALAVGAVLAAAIYLAGYHTPDLHTPPLAALARPVPLALYIASYVGRPVLDLFHYAIPAAPSFPKYAVFAGTAGILGALVLAAHLVRARGKVRPAQFGLLAVIAFIGGTAFITALGRLDFGIGQSYAGRYATPAILFWVALGGLVASRAAGQGRRVVGAVALIALALAAAGAPTIIAFAHSERQNRADGLTAILSKAGDGEALARLLDNPAVIAVNAAELEKARLAVYALPWSHWLGQPLATVAPDRTETGCTGTLAVAGALAGPAAGAQAGWRVAGSSRSASGLPFRTVILTDAAGVVAGYGMTDSRDAADGTWSGWRGHVRPGTAGPVAAWGLGDDGAPCRFAGPVALSGG